MLISSAHVCSCNRVCLQDNAPFHACADYFPLRPSRSTQFWSPANHELLPAWVLTFSISELEQLISCCFFLRGLCDNPVLLPCQPGGARVLEVPRALGGRDGDLVGRRAAVGGPALRAQVLQPLHLQQPLVRGRLPQPAGLRRLRGVERAEPGRARLAARPLAGPHGRRPVLPPVRRRLLRRRPDGRLVLPPGHDRVHAALARLVRARRLLHEGPRRLTHAGSEPNVCPASSLSIGVM
jgi:hypothetical protein